MKKTIKNIMELFPVSRGIARYIKNQILYQCDNYSADKIMREFNKMINGYGVEAIRKEGEHIDNYYYDIVVTYINTGDLYSPTIIHESKSRFFILTTLGDYLENNN